MKKENRSEKMGLRPPHRSAQLEIGDVLTGGAVYAGISPDTHETLIITAEDAPTPLFWTDAMIYAAGLDRHGAKDWRLPTVLELNHLYKNKHKLPHFVTSCSFYTDEFKSKMYYWAFRNAELLASWKETFNGVATNNTSPLKISALVQDWLRANKNDWGTVYDAPSQRFDSGEQDAGYCMMNRFSARFVRTLKRP